MYKVMKKVISGVFCHFLFRVKYENIEEINKYEQCIICPNHSNIYDPFFIFPKVDNMYIMAKKEIFKNKLFAKLLRHYQVFPVNRETVDSKATITSIKIFENNNNAKLLIFPEGKVVKTKEEVGKIRNGAVFFSATTQVPIIPVHITQRPKFFSKVKVKVGQPMYMPKEIVKDKETIRNKSKELLKNIYEL